MDVVMEPFLHVPAQSQRAPVLILDRFFLMVSPVLLSRAMHIYLHLLPARMPGKGSVWTAGLGG